MWSASDMDWNLVPNFLGIVGGVGSTLVFLTYWLSNKFQQEREYFFTKVDTSIQKVIDKLEYHERHDDQRFGELRDDMWEMRLRIAAQKLVINKADDENETAEEITVKRRPKRSSITG